METDILLIIKRDALRNAVKLQINYINEFVCEVAWNNLNPFPGNGKVPDLVIMDCELYPVIGSAPTSWLHTKWIVLLKEESDPCLIDALFAGANAFFLLKDEPVHLYSIIVDTIKNTVDTDIVRLIRKLSKSGKANTNTKSYNLTIKEQDILKLMTRGLHFKAIAIETGNTYETIRTHVKRIYKKLEVETASEAILKALNMNNDK